MAQLANVLTRPPRPPRRLSRSRRLWRSVSSHRLATQATDLAATVNDLTQTFAYNPASQNTSVTRSNDLYAWTGHFNQNDPSTPNGLNQVTNAGAKAVTHDSKGNITAVGTDSYGYASENFLTTGPGSAALSYDPMGRLYQVTQGAATNRMGYDGLDRITEYDAANAVQRRYIHGPGVDNPITWYEGTGTATRRFLSADERGSIIAVTDNAGAVLGINKYDEYGVPQTTNLGKFGYTGQAWLPEVGLWHYKARAYRPDIGRFMQTDPIGYGDSPNLYAYVGNDPVNSTDPLGLWGGGGPRTVVGPVIVVTGKRKPKPISTPVDPTDEIAFPGPDLWWTIQREDIGEPGEREKNKPIPCVDALKEPGKIRATGVTVTAVLGLGWTLTKGSWFNMSTGTSGRFFTMGFAAGVEAGGNVSIMTYSNIGAFTGFSDGYSLGASAPLGPVSVGGSYSSASNTSGSGSGGSLGIASPSLPLLGASGNLTETTISQCRNN